MELVAEAEGELGVVSACRALKVARASYYRWRNTTLRPARPRSHRALGAPEREAVLTVLNEERFVDQAPGQVFAALLDEGSYLCSERTMYRILAEQQQVRERRDQLRHPRYAAPELLATAPNQLWSWDITKLLGPAKWTYFYLYLILDIFSRYVVGWMVAHRESATLAKRLIQASCERQGIQERQLVLHADRGSSMTSKSLALLLADLGITKTHSRPHVSNDNPYSEAQFKTLKYRPNFPDRFGCLEHARAVCADLIDWYCLDHRHSGLAMLTPYDVHYGLGPSKLAARAQVLEAAYALHPERFPRGLPKPATLPTEVWINKPKTGVLEQTIGQIPMLLGENGSRGWIESAFPDLTLDRSTPKKSPLDAAEVVL
jgi:putative transposase